MFTAVKNSNLKALPLIIHKCETSKFGIFLVVTERLWGPLSLLRNAFACFRDSVLSRPGEQVEVKNTQSFACKLHALLELR
jgi:hypothetical protein